MGNFKYLLPAYFRLLYAYQKLHRDRYCQYQVNTTTTREKEKKEKIRRRYYNIKKPRNSGKRKKKRKET